MAALFLLPLIQVLVRFLPFQRVMQIFRLRTASVAMAKPLSAVQEADVVLVLRVFQLIERKFSFWPGRCLAQALLARSFLRQQKIPCALCLGAKSDAFFSSMQAHAWLTAGKYTVTGQQTSEQYIAVAIFQ